CVARPREQRSPQQIGRMAHCTASCTNRKPGCGGSRSDPVCRALPYVRWPEVLVESSSKRHDRFICVAEWSSALGRIGRISKSHKGREGHLSILPFFLQRRSVRCN